MLQDLILCKCLNNINTLSTEEQNYLAAIVNALSDGGHPYATVNNLSYFVKDFLITCVKKACDIKDKEKSLIAKNIYDKLNGERND